MPFGQRLRYATIGHPPLREVNARVTKEDQVPAQPPVDPGDEDDTEGHAFKWHVETDAKGQPRLRQAWNPEDGPAGRLSSSAPTSRKLDRPRQRP
jgi:hypothetical protein